MRKIPTRKSACCKRPVNPETTLRSRLDITALNVRKPRDAALLFAGNSPLEILRGSSSLKEKTALFAWLV